MSAAIERMAQPNQQEVSQGFPPVGKILAHAFLQGRLEQRELFARRKRKHEPEENEGIDAGDFAGAIVEGVVDEAITDPGCAEGCLGFGAKAAGAITEIALRALFHHS